MRPVDVAGLALSALSCVAVVSAQSQGLPPKSQKELAELRDQKLRSGFLKGLPWTTSFAVARQAAKAEQKLIFAYFTRSFAPSPACKHIEDELFATPAFHALASPVVLLCHVTSRVKGDADQGLMQRYRGEGYPFLIGLDEEGRPVARFEGEFNLASIKAFLSAEIGGYAALRAKAKKGDKSAKAEFLIRRIGLGHLKPDAIQAILASADYLTEAHKKTIHQGLAVLEIREILARIDSEDPESFHRAAERLVAMKKAGRVPSGRHAPIFWQVILGYADTTEDPELFEEALTKIQGLPDVRHPEQWIRRMQLRLRALQFMKGKRRE